MLGAVCASFTRGFEGTPPGFPIVVTNIFKIYVTVVVHVKSEPVTPSGR